MVCFSVVVYVDGKLCMSVCKNVHGYTAVQDHPRHHVKKKTAEHHWLQGALVQNGVREPGIFEKPEFPLLS